MLKHSLGKPKRPHAGSIGTFNQTLPEACKNCDASFAHKRKLDRHKASVHGEKKPYVCRICDTIYLDKQCLQKHIRTTHANILPPNFKISAINELIKTDATVEIKCEICRLRSSVQIRI